MKLRNKKTGEIGHAIFINADSADYARTIRMRFGGNLYAFRTMKEMMDRFEDYTPSEPLIKDEKIRKVVRLWSSVNGDTKVFYCRSTNQICVFDNEGYVVRSIRFKLEFREDMGLEDGYYTVAELCGEEEEC